MHPFDLLQAEALGLDTLEFVRVPSETGTEQPGSQFFADLLQREGFETEFDPVDSTRSNVYARLPGLDPRAPVFVLNGHTDTIPIGASAPPALADGFVIGRGAEDMKGGLVAMVHAASALRRSRVRLLGDVWLTGVVDHETPRGKKLGPLRLIEHLRSGRIRANGLLIAEGPAAIWAASLGSSIFNVEIASPRGIVHTIKVPYRENPAYWAGRLLTEFGRLEEEFALQGADPLCGSERLNVGMIQAGDYPNRLPTPVTVTGTWRWRPGGTHAAVRRVIERLCDELGRESGLSFAVRFEATREAFETPADHPLSVALDRASRAAGYRAERIGMALVGDGNLYANQGGVPTVYFGPAHETAHSDFERVALQQLLLCARVYAAAMMEFCGIA
jgi:acetylornithine deacetylase/succinyl-diaminopimelate desuccinylase-like protein